ncbi:MAG TPA: hypothetical protein VFI20_08360 [Terracidiphilus sp.]|nr:hypothetical protein [Terracidiphilus sp.]
MKITIHGLDYTIALDAAHPLTIERRLNEPSVCQLWLSLPAGGSLASPARNQSLTVTGDDGTYYFTGYIAVTPLPEYAGDSIAGPRYRIAVRAFSDEMLLDQLALAPSKSMPGEAAGALIKALVTRTGSSSLSSAGLMLGATVSHFAPGAGAPWSRSAGQVANQARAAYRSVNNALSLSSVPGVSHALSEADGTLTLANLSFTAGTARALANDITVCGEHEPVAYVSEYFVGDGVTSQFILAAQPYLLPPSQSTLIHELFNETQIDPRVWSNSGGFGYLALGAGGLAMQGGNGIDGETMLTWLDPIEMGGTLLLEATGVALAPFSTGILAGFFTGLNTLSGCTAGFQVTSAQGSGAVSVQPVAQGTPSGAIYSINPSNQYALRIRVHCPENQRVLAIYRTLSDTGAVTYGGQWRLGSAKLQFEIQEFVNGVAGMPVTLFDGALANLPGTCTLAAASSLNLIGSMRTLSLGSLGSGWVVSTPAGGTPYTRRLATSAQSGECYLENTGRLVFNAGFVPPAGEQIAVTYRSAGRAVGRAVNADSQQQLAQQGLPSEITWIGSVVAPSARCSQDCRNAAQALAQAAASVNAGWSGTYKGTQADFAADVWPGDALLLNSASAGIDTGVVVRSVRLSYRASYPDLVEYTIIFANDWAEDLAIKTSSTVPADTWLPAPVAPTLLASLAGLTVTALSGTAVSIDAGVTPPSGGGFEIRRRDFAFMAGNDADLVMRSTQPAMTFARESVADRFYIRMYDGQTPPNYSEFSAALLINLPLG